MITAHDSEGKTKHKTF